MARRTSAGDTTILVVDDDPLMLTLVGRTSRDQLLGHGVELPETQLLKKPFVPIQLLARIRDVLTA